MTEPGPALALSTAGPDSNTAIDGALLSIVRLLLGGFFSPPKRPGLTDRHVS